MDACRGERRSRSYETRDEGVTDPCSDCARKPAQLLREELTLPALSVGIYATGTGFQIGQWGCVLNRAMPYLPAPTARIVTISWG